MPLRHPPARLEVRTRREHVNAVGPPTRIATTADRIVEQKFFRGGSMLHNRTQVQYSFHLGGVSNCR